VHIFRRLLPQFGAKSTADWKGFTWNRFPDDIWSSFQVEEKLNEYEETKTHQVSATTKNGTTSKAGSVRPVSYHQESEVGREKLVLGGDADDKEEHKKLLLPHNVEYERFEREDRDPADPELERQLGVRQRTLSTGQRVFRCFLLIILYYILKLSKQIMKHFFYQNL